jgi:hypothetical protein
MLTLRKPRAVALAVVMAGLYPLRLAVRDRPPRRAGGGAAAIHYFSAAVTPAAEPRRQARGA